MSISPAATRATTRLMRLLFISLAVVASLVTGAAPAMARSFVEFESGQVRPVAMTPDGTKLLAVNTPDNALEVFTDQQRRLPHPYQIHPCGHGARRRGGAQQQLKSGW